MHQNRKSRVLELVTRAALPTASTGMPRPCFVGVDASPDIALVGADGTVVRPATGADALSATGVANVWATVTFADSGGAGTVAVLSGFLYDGLGQAVVGGVFDCVVSAAGNVTCVPAAVTGTLGPVVPGFNGAAAEACSFSGASGALGAFNFTITTGAGALTTLAFTWRHVRRVYTCTTV